MSVSLKEGVKMKQLKKQWNKVTALLLTIGMVLDYLRQCRYRRRMEMRPEVQFLM